MYVEFPAVRLCQLPERVAVASSRSRHQIACAHCHLSVDTGRPTDWAVPERPVSQSFRVCLHMGKIIISTNMTLDGVVQDPDGGEGFRLGGWFGRFGGKDLEDWAKVETAEAQRADALLLGRRSDEWFATRWNDRSGAWADRLNRMPKYVLSSNLSDPKWSHVTVLHGDVSSEVARLKQETSGEILVYASYQLVHALIEHDLVDEYRLVIFPVVLGGGERLFGETTDRKPVRLVNTTTIGDGLAFVTYEVLRGA